MCLLHPLYMGPNINSHPSVSWICHNQGKTIFIMGIPLNFVSWTEIHNESQRDHWCYDNAQRWRHVHDNAQRIATGSSSVPHFQIAESEMTTAALSDFEYQHWVTLNMAVVVERESMGCLLSNWKEILWESWIWLLHDAFWSEVHDGNGYKELIHVKNCSITGSTINHVWVDDR